MPQRDERGRFVAADFGGSPGGPDGGMGKFTTELQEATKSLGTFDKVTEQTTKTVTRSGRAAGGGGGRGFAANTAAKIGRQTVRAAGFDLLSFVATQGVSMGLNAGAGAGYSLGKSIASNPTLAKALDLDLTLMPSQRAGQRTLGITGAMARLGADPEEIGDVRRQIFGQFFAQEQAAAKEGRAVELLERATGAEKAGEAAVQRIKSAPLKLTEELLVAPMRALWAEIRADIPNLFPQSR